MLDIIMAIDIKLLIFFTGMIILSFVFYKLSDRFKPNRSWAQSAAGTAVIVYAALGGIYGYLLPALAAITLTFILYYPLRLLCIMIIDALQKNNYAVIKIEDEDFRKLDVDSQLSLLNMRIKYYRKAIIRLQMCRGLAVMTFIISLSILVLGLLVLRKLDFSELLLLLTNIILFILIFNITPRTKGIFYEFLRKYVFAPETIKLRNYYEQQLQESNYEIKAIEHGYHVATKQQIMNRLKF